MILSKHSSFPPTIVRNLYYSENPNQIQNLEQVEGNLLKFASDLFTAFNIPRIVIVKEINLLDGWHSDCLGAGVFFHKTNLILQKKGIRLMVSYEKVFPEGADMKASE